MRQRKYFLSDPDSIFLRDEAPIGVADRVRFVGADALQSSGAYPCDAAGNVVKCERLSACHGAPTYPVGCGSQWEDSRGVPRSEQYSNEYCWECGGPA